MLNKITTGARVLHRERLDRYTTASEPMTIVERSSHTRIEGEVLETMRYTVLCRVKDRNGIAGLKWIAPEDVIDA